MRKRKLKKVFCIFQNEANLIFPIAKHQHQNKLILRLKKQAKKVQFGPSKKRAKTGQNGPKRAKTGQNGPKRAKTGQNGPFFSRLIYFFFISFPRKKK
jgi:hypothetical protein